MQLHANAKLTPVQRQEIYRLYHQEHRHQRALARQFQVNLTTLGRWANRPSPLDRSSAPKTPRTLITEDYRAAVIAYRTEPPHHGPIRIAQALQEPFPQAKKGTVYTILTQAGLCGKGRPTSRPRGHHPIPTGHHRVQMDLQTLPAIPGAQGQEYKISVIHTRTRIKYSEIHPKVSSERCAQVLARAIRALPPFF